MNHDEGQAVTRYAVMVNNEMLPRSLSTTRSGASSYLGDARHYAAADARVRLVQLKITDVPKPKVKPKAK